MQCFKPKLEPEEDLFCDCKPMGLSLDQKIESRLKEQAKTIDRLEKALQVASNEIVTLRAINHMRRPS